MTAIVIDGLNEEHFRRSIENRLREGRANLAIDRLRALLANYAGPGRVLPQRFLTVDARDLTLTGWDTLGDAICKHDQPEHPVTALSIAFGWQGDELPNLDADGGLRPHVETSYFTDEAFPFSQCGREDLLDGYSSEGSTWSGDSVATDTALTLEGIDDLQGVLASLEAKLLVSDTPDEEEIRAGSLGACLISALLVQAVTERIARDGLPRPVCVMAGSSDVYPYFEAPVAGIPEDARQAADVQEEVAETQSEHERKVATPRYESLLMTSIPRGQKRRPVLVIEESHEELEARLADLHSLDHAYGSEAAQAGTNPAAPATQQFDFPAAQRGDHHMLAEATHQAEGYLNPLETHDLPGLHYDVPAASTPPLEPVHAREPIPYKPAPPELTLPEPAFSPLALSAPRSERVGESTLTPFEPALQQRLQSLLSANTQFLAEARAPAGSAPAGPPVVRITRESGELDDQFAGTKPEELAIKSKSLPEPAHLWTRLRVWEGWQYLQLLGHALSATIAYFLTVRHDAAPPQPVRKRGLPNL